MSDRFLASLRPLAFVVAVGLPAPWIVLALRVGLPSCAFVALAFTAPSAQSPPRPNIVMVIMDDLGYGDVGSYGAPDAKTPNIDRLAREGVKLTDFYANHANCSPTRTGFITGRYQQRYGIESPLRPIDDARQLLPSDTSLPRLLKSAGYATGLVGKWHLGARAEVGPNRHGFDEFWGFRGGAVDYYTHNVVTPMKLPAPIHDLYHNEEPTKVTGYLTDEITARSEAFIQQHGAAPFFLEVAYNATHWPFQGPDLPEAKRGWTNFIESGTRADYMAMLERADQGIGRILGLLDRLKLAANTLVIFTSDNGGEWLSRNAPLFHRKGTLWEGGIRVPLLMRWPVRLKPGITSSQVGITMDLTASILAAAGITPPASYRPEGMDLIGPLQKGMIVDRTLFWRLPAPPNAAGPAAQRAVRRGNWKYLQDRGQNFLYDVRADPGEQRDVAQSHIAIWQELRGLADKWEADVDAEATQRATPIPLHAQANRSELLLTRASAYVREFVARFVNVVAEERYVQETSVPRRKRHLRSDLLLVKPDPSGWFVTFRDVLEVDGKPVPDRDDRLTTVFLQPADERLAARVRQIAEAGARYNLNNFGTLNNPLLAVGFLQSRYRDRFRFLAGTNDKEVGPRVWTLQFTEFRTPTILKGNANGDLPARGTLWVEEDTGRIVKSELQVGARVIDAVRITTTFGLDERLQVYVPIEMREYYPNDYGTNTIATYSRFRRFDVNTEETIHLERGPSSR